MFQCESRVARQMRETYLMPSTMFLLRGITIRDPHVGGMPLHHVMHDASSAGVIGLMHNRVLAVENPVVRVRPLNPHAGFVAGDKTRGAQNSLAAAPVKWATTAGLLATGYPNSRGGYKTRRGAKHSS